MKRPFLFLLSIPLVILFLLLIAWYVPMPLDPYQDFQVLYRADKGILNGVALYDQPGQAQMIADDLNVSIDRVFVLPFPYPPWYAVFTLPLALLPIEVAVRMWLFLNFAMLLFSVWLLTYGWDPRKRLYSFIAVILFLPVFGALLVGQYVFPAILGISLTTFALRHRLIGLTALGLALATFKPHIGAFVLLAVLVLLLLQGDEYSRRTFLAVVLAGTLLFFAGFIADKAWPVTYYQSLFNFKTVSECNLCVSMPLTISHMIGLGFDQSASIAGILLGILIILFIRSRYQLYDEAFISFFVCVALMVNPYLQNYDFSFAIIPLFYLAGQSKSKLDWLWVLIIFFLPWVGLGVFGREGNSVLLVSGVAMIYLILTRLYKKHTIADNSI